MMSGQMETNISFNRFGLEIDGVEPYQAAIRTPMLSSPLLNSFDEPDFGHLLLTSKSSPHLCSPYINQIGVGNEKISQRKTNWIEFSPEEELTADIGNLELSDVEQETGSDSGLDCCNEVELAPSSGVPDIITNVEQLHNLFYQQNDEGDTRLHLAVVNGDTTQFATQLQYTFSDEMLNIQNLNGHAALHLAVAADQVDLVRMLVVCGADVLVQDREGRTPLHIACEMGNFDAVKALTVPVLEYETNMADLRYTPPPQAIPQPGTVMNFTGESCMHLAAKAHSLDILQHLVEKCGHDINIQEHKSGNTILHYAVQQNKTQLLHFLLSCRNVDFYGHNFQHHTALYLANCQPISRNLIYMMRPDLAAIMEEEMLENITDDED